VSAGALTGAAARSDSTRLRRHARSRRLRENLVAYLFLAPALVFFVGFLLIPVGWVVRQSFLEGGVLGPAQWVGFENWNAALADPQLRSALKNTLLYTVMVVPLTALLALGLAMLMRSVQRGGATLRTAIYVPSLAPPTLLALVWVFVVNPEIGLLNIGTRALGQEPINFLGDPKLALPTLAVLDVWRSVGTWALLLFAALSMIPRQLFQAAEIDGAGAWRRFWHVALPGVRATLAVICVLAIVFSMQVFDSVFILTKGSPEGSTETVVYYIYTSVFEAANPGYGAVLSIILLVTIVALTASVAKLASLVLRRGSRQPEA
jgi:ABC-type sugar transport system permease subunit